MTALKIEGMSKSFHGRPVLRNVDLSINPGELTVIIGRSGCGKSTLLRCLNGLEVFDSGRVSFGDLNLEHGGNGSFETSARALRNNFGMVFQSFNLFPHLTVLENLMKAPMVVRHIDRAAAEKTAMALLTKVGLSEHIHHYPSQLSGGQQQRAAIARALAMSPKVMLYDEPTSALDPWLVGEVFQVMKKLDGEGMTQVIVTHEMRFVREMADKIVFMDEGQIVECGTPAQFFEAKPKDERTREYLGRFV